MCYNTEKRSCQLNVSWASSWDFEEVNSTITNSIADFPLIQILKNCILSVKMTSTYFLRDFNLTDGTILRSYKDLLWTAPTQLLKPNKSVFVVVWS